MAQERPLQVEYAKSGRSACKACDGLISQDSIRIGKETPSDRFDGFDVSWYHLKCCNNKGLAPKIKVAGHLKGWELLRWDDQIKIRKSLGETIEDNDEESLKEKQNRELWDLKDQITDAKVKTKTLAEVLEANGIELKKLSPARVLHRVADGLLYGKMGACPVCNNKGTMQAYGTKFKCKGWLSEYTPCDFEGTDGVKRYKWIVPSSVKSDKFFKSFKFTKDHPKEVEGDDDDGKNGKEEVKEEEEEEEPEEEEDENIPEDDIPKKKEMWGMNVAIAGTKKELGMSQDDLAKLITKHGGEVDDDISTSTRFLIATESETTKKKKTKKVQFALDNNIPIFTVGFVENLCNREEEGIKLRQLKHCKEYMYECCSDPTRPLCKKYNKERIAAAEKKAEEEEAKERAKEEERQEKEKRKQEEIAKKIKPRKEPVPGSDILKVDPGSGMENKGKVYYKKDKKFGYVIYHVMLNQTVLATGANKYYRIQIIKTNKGNFKLWLSYGRIGSERGSGNIYDGDEGEMIEKFRTKFEEHTGNKWNERHLFEKKAGKYFMVELDDGNEEEEDENDEHMQAMKERRKKRKEGDGDAMEVEKKSNLDPRVKSFIDTIFDTDMMKKALKDMDIDVKKMPLGKIKRSQIKDGYALLTEIQDVISEITKNGSSRPLETKMKDLTARFYTVIPHDFGNHSPPVIQEIEEVSKKIQLLDTLLDLEIAAEVMEAGKVFETDPSERNYKALKLDMKPVEKDSDLYKMLETYANQSHDRKYFSRFDFKVEDILAVDREGEQEKFDPWAKTENRTLLWHGSRLTNWVGILSTGLRIAPPEAPKTGYRFGKGVYFADIISKSASYCFTSNENPTGVMLLAEVALGETNDLKKDEYMEKAPAGFHSTKALGMTIPNPKEDREIPENVRVPMGKPVSSGLKTACSHNEFIVYDTRQIRIRYVLKLKFSHEN
eukprot:TRINITY_DN2316_c0_g2_i1.p1 TRINITY_DN2316_c0_g2~~TRINITY_DN2316_c0_g2_i1.p1  ORF type:complete len:946 (+),score=391.25 TRINITY_DN2316_c0_g2_i1:86-2923(+)